MMLIADEVHNLGGGSFLTAPPLHIDYRLGLSATPERQYDPDGTARLKEYFGDVVFEFGLAEAIGVCLVPYDYHLHPVGLSHHELEEYRTLSDKIRRLMLAAGPDPSVGGRGATATTPSTNAASFLRRRRENSKCSRRCSRRVLRMKCGTRLCMPPTRIPSQLEAVNEIVRSLGLRFHQITAHETGSASLVDSVLDAFRGGSLKVLTAKRVLDEGLERP